MDAPSLYSRRQFNRHAAVAIAGLVPILSRQPAMGMAASEWRAADGLRLAGSVSGPASLDPALSRDLTTNFLLRQCFRGLVSMDADLNPTFEIAESIEMSDDGRTYGVTLRETARFHDGRAILPEDVVVSFSRALNPAIAGGSVNGLAGITYLRDIEGATDVLTGASATLSGIEITGDRTLTISLAQPSPTFLLKLASIPASIVDGEQVRDPASWPDIPNGSGPFAIAAWEPGLQLLLEASESWWRGQPELAAIEVRLGTSASQPLNIFQAGEIELVQSVPPELVDLVVDPASGVEYGTLLESDLFSTSYIAFGNQVPPLDDVHVRRALQLVFPAERVAEATFNGAMSPATSLIPPGMLGMDWPVDRALASTDAARAELAKSRYGGASGVPVISIFAADIAQVEALRDIAFEELGLEIEAIQVSWGDFLTGLSSRRFPAYALYWGADYADPEAMVDMLFGADSADNYTGYANPDLEALLLMARNSAGEDRIAAFQAANQLLIDDAAMIPLYHAKGFALIQEGIGGIDLTPMGIAGLESVREA